jgi:hypothetical protein
VDIDVQRTELQDQLSEPSENSARARVGLKAARDSSGIEAWETEGGAVVSCVNVEPYSRNTAPPRDFKKE